MFESSQGIPLDKQVVSFEQRPVRKQELPPESVTAGICVPCIESTASAVMRQLFHLKKCSCVLHCITIRDK